MNCLECDAELPPGSAFCPHCGTRVAAPAPVAETEFMGDGTHFASADSSSPRLEAGSVFDDRYTIEHVLGAGGMGVVYQAFDSVARRSIALKLINPRLLSGTNAVDRLITEGLTTRDIRHPNVVAVYDVAKADDQPYVTMEYIDGRSLRNWLSKQLTSGGEVTLSAAVGIINAILDGLEAAHDLGITHRDVKPENVILLGEPNDGDFRLKLLDFGIARAVNVSMLQTSAAALGTPLYMAPEQRTTPDAAGPAADIYSLGRMFYELLMDVLPDGTWQPPSKHRSDIPEAVDWLLEKALSNRPRSRQQSVGEFRNELSEAIANRPPHRRPEPQRAQQTQPAPRTPSAPRPQQTPQQQRPQQTQQPQKKKKGPPEGHTIGIIAVAISGSLTLLMMLGTCAQM